MPEARRRVWAALQAAGTRAQVSPAMRRSSFPVLALMAGLLLVGGTAGAVIGQRSITARLARPPEPARADSWPGKSAAPCSDRGGSRSAPSAPPQAFAPVSAGERHTPPASARLRRASSDASEHRAHGSRRGAVACAAFPGIGILGWAGARGDGDAAPGSRPRARRGIFLARYLAAHPRGALREEALVLSIEAAGAQGDSRGVERLVSQYRASYRTGRFKTYVDSHMENHPNSTHRSSNG